MADADAPASVPPDPWAAGLAQLGEAWSQALALWQPMLAPLADALPPPPADKRFRDEAWEQPFFKLARQAHAMMADNILAAVDALEIDPRRKAQLRFAARSFAEATSPANFPLTNPEVIERTRATGGDNLLTGLTRMMDDAARGQLSHVPGGAFELGRDLATTPGKVVKRTPLYELIQYAPASEAVLAAPLVIFPPWINRFYILDLTPEKSFIRWAVGEGLTVFVVSWKSADASMKDLRWDDYVEAQVDAIETVRALLSVPAVHAIGYCVAGTTLAATLALLAARGEADRVATATFLTAQVDFAGAGDLLHFVDDEQLGMLAGLSPEGVFDGRYLAATFNLLRGRDLIWKYVTENYWLGRDYQAFDLLHWNGDVTNLPAAWHLGYLKDLYRDNLLVVPGALSVGGTPIDLGRVDTPLYVQAGREDHIAPAASVWRITEHVRGPVRFVLAGSGHIAGVVNPPAAGKYQFWVNEDEAGGGAASFDAFVAAAREVKGSWWPDWRGWIEQAGSDRVPAEGARVPGQGSLPALDEAPGRYVRAR